MTPERIAALVARWVRLYTGALPEAIAQRRAEEINADLCDHIEHDRLAGTSERGVAISILSRMVRGMPADVMWRHEHRTATTDASSTTGGRMDTARTWYRLGVGLAIAGLALLLWGVMAMGVIGMEGDPFDLLYFAVLAVGILGSVIVRFEPSGMVRVLLAMAAAQAAITVIALLVGKQESPVSSVAEIVGLNAAYVGLYLAAAWLFRRAARQQPPRTS